MSLVGTKKHKIKGKSLSVVSLDKFNWLLVFLPLPKNQIALEFKEILVQAVQDILVRFQFVQRVMFFNDPCFNIILKVNFLFKAICDTGVSLSGIKNFKIVFHMLVELSSNIA